MVSTTLTSYAFALAGIVTGWMRSWLGVYSVLQSSRTGPLAMAAEAFVSLASATLVVLGTVNAGRRR